MKFTQLFIVSLLFLITFVHSQGPPNIKLTINSTEIINGTALEASIRFSHYTIIGTSDVIIFKYFFDIEDPKSNDTNYWAISKIPMTQKMIPFTDIESTIVNLTLGEHFVIVNVAKAPLQYGAPFDVNSNEVWFNVTN